MYLCIPVHAISGICLARLLRDSCEILARVLRDSCEILASHVRYQRNMEESQVQLGRRWNEALLLFCMKVCFAMQELLGIES